MKGEKTPLGCFQQGYRLTSVIYKEDLETKILLWVKKITKRSDYVFRQDGAPAHTASTMQDWLDANTGFWPKDLWLAHSPGLKTLDCSLWTHVEERASRTRQSNTEDRGFCERRKALDEERLREEDLQKLPATNLACYYRQWWSH